MDDGVIGLTLGIVVSFFLTMLLTIPSVKQEMTFMKYLNSCEGEYTLYLNGSHSYFKCENNDFAMNTKGYGMLITNQKPYVPQDSSK